MQLGLKGKITILFSLLFIIGTVIVGMYSIYTVSEDIKILAGENLLKNFNLAQNVIDAEFPGEWEMINGKLHKGDQVIHEQLEIVDKIAGLTKGTVTIFQGDTRIATNVTKEDGTKAVGTKVAEQVADVTLMQGNRYTGEANVVGRNFYTIYDPIKDRNGEIIGMLFVGYPTEAYDKMVNQFTRNIIIFIMVELFLFIIIIYFFVRRMVQPLTQLSEVAKEVANGNLQETVQELNQKDEIGELSKSIKLMVDNLKKLIGQVKATSEQTSVTAQELAASSEITSETSSQIAKSINEIAEGANAQAQETSKVLEQIEDAFTQVNEGYELVQSTLQRAESSTLESEKGNQAINEAIQHLTTVTNTVSFATDSIQKLGRRSEEIGGIISLISDISNQTNLLALNAAIEAARAGEHGRGFAIVAEEVRKLSEQTNIATNQITALIQDIQSETSVTVNTMETNLDAVKTQVDIIKKGGQSLSTIVKMVKDTETGVNEIKLVFDTIQENVKKVLISTENISSIIEQSAATSEEVAASTEEQSASVDEIALHATELSKLAEKLERELVIFKL